MTDNFDFTLWTDTEKAARIEKLRQSNPIEITGNEVPYSENLWQYRKNAMEYGKTLRGIYVNKDTGKSIYLAASGVKEVLEHDYKDVEHLQSIAAIPNIIKNSIYIAALKNENISKNTDVLNYEYYLVGLKISSIDYTVKAVVVNAKNGERYYDHKLTKIEKGKLIDLVNQSVNNSFVSSGLSSTGELEECKTALSGDQKIETTTSSVSEYKDKRLFSILQIKNVKTIGGVELSYEQRQLLMLGEAIKLYDITDKQGKKRNILVQWNTNANKLKISEIKAEHIVQKVAPSAALQKILDAPSILDNGEDSPQIKRRNRGLSL